MKTGGLSGLILACLFAVLPGTAFSGQAVADRIQSGQRIAFVGGMVRPQPYDYDRCVVQGLKANGIVVEEVVPSLFRLSSSSAMRAAFQEQVLDRKPDWMLLNCGVNDAYRRVSIEDYARDVTAIVDLAQRAGIKAMLMAPTIRERDLECAPNKRSAEYTGFMKSLAKAKELPFANLNSLMRAQVKAIRARDRIEGLVFTGDGVHFTRGYTDRRDRNIMSFIMEQHQRSRGNAVIIEYMLT